MVDNKLEKRRDNLQKAAAGCGGVLYAAVWTYGLVVDQASSANFLPVNTADNWLHFMLAVAMIGLGLALGRRSTTASAPRTVPRQAH